jgi:hypothetical protein
MIYLLPDFPFSHPFNFLTFKSAIMKKSLGLSSIFIFCTTLLALVFGFQVKGQAPDRSISSWQFRHVPNDKIEEFIKRETTHWSKVAQKAVDNKTMTFWALFEKVGGYDLPNSSNYLFINTYPDIDKAGSIWNDAESIAGVKIGDMEDYSFTTVTSEFFVKDREWTQSAKAVPAKDFNYVVMNYQNTNYPDSLIGLEKKYWEPFIKGAMDKGWTQQVAWGNAVVLAPRGENIKTTTVSFDLYKTLGDALLQTWDPKTVIPAKLFPLLAKIQVNRPGIAVYRLIKVITAP